MTSCEALATELHVSLENKPEPRTVVLRAIAPRLPPLQTCASPVDPVRAQSHTVAPLPTCLLSISCPARDPPEERREQGRSWSPLIHGLRPHSSGLLSWVGSASHRPHYSDSSGPQTLGGSLLAHAGLGKGSHWGKLELGSGHPGHDTLPGRDSAQPHIQDGRLCGPWELHRRCCLSSVDAFPPVNPPTH